MSNPHTDERLSASLEDYLEAIHHIVHLKGAARPKDIASRLEVNNSSVTAALKALAGRELINYAPYDVVTLTPAGQRVAADVVRRHEALKNFFTKVLAVDDSLAEQGACKMEHAVPRAIVDRFIQFVDFVEICPRGGTRFVEGFGYHCRHGCGLDDCDRCVSLALDVVQDRRAELVGGRRVRRTLDALDRGSRARVIAVNGGDDARDRLHGQGFQQGALVEVDAVSADGSSLRLSVQGYHLVIGSRDASLIEVEDL